MFYWRKECCELSACKQLRKGFVERCCGWSNERTSPTILVIIGWISKQVLHVIDHLLGQRSNDCTIIWIVNTMRLLLGLWIENSKPQLWIRIQTLLHFDFWTVIVVDIFRWGIRARCRRRRHFTLNKDQCFFFLSCGQPQAFNYLTVQLTHR